MEIKLLTASDLKQFIESNEFDRLEHIPISKVRTLSHINNPRLESKDIIMFMAYEGDFFAGYLGAVPDYIFIKDKAQKIAWLSCMWVDKSMRGKGIAPKLLAKANEIWQQNLLIVNFTPTAKSSYDKINAFTELKTYKGYRFYRRLKLSILLPNKNKKYKKYKLFLQIVDFGFNIFNDIKNAIEIKKTDKNISFEYVNFVDKTTENFINQLNNNNLTKRNKKELDWIITYPWILNAPLKNNEALRYEFSVSEKNFLTLNIKVFYKKSLIGFLMLNIRNKHLRIPYIFCKEKDIHIIAQAIIIHVKKLKINYITVFNSNLISELKKYLQFFYKKEQKRTFLITDKLLDKYPDSKNYYFQDGDGDSAFT